MDVEQIDAEMAADAPAVREAIKRGLLEAYGDWDEIEGEYSGHIRAIICAVRVAVAPLI